MLGKRPITEPGTVILTEVTSAGLLGDRPAVGWPGHGAPWGTLGTDPGSTGRDTGPGQQPARPPALIPDVG